MHCVRPPFHFRLIGRQMVEVGYYSLPVVGLTALFTGMVLALQSYSGFSRFNAESAVAVIVVLSITRELAPVLAGLMVGRPHRRRHGGRDRHHARDRTDRRADRRCRPIPFKYLVAPRLIAGTLTLPLCVLAADVIGVFGGYLVAVNKLGFNTSAYLKSTYQYLEVVDVAIRAGQGRGLRLSDRR